MIKIKGFEKTSLVDWEGKISSVIFLPLCNFACGYCHSWPLVKNWQTLPDFSLEKILKFLEKKKGWIDGVVITGGEPTIHGSDLKFLLKKIKEIGFLTKIDTNGSNPDLLEELIEEKIVDYIAMDIKSSPEKYAKATRTKVDLKKINQSIALLITKNLDYEFRTTVVPGIVEEKDIIKIGSWIKGAKVYALQQFRNIEVAQKEYTRINPYSKEEIQKMISSLKGKVNKIIIRA